MFCNTSLANVMKEPSHKGELHTQIFYGDTIILTDERQGGWSKIKVDWDNYAGWMLTSQLSEWKQYEANIAVLEVAVSVKPENQNATILFPGTFITKTILESNQAVMEGKYSLLNTMQTMDETTKERCLMYLNVPYMWGGNTHVGIDCSGLSQMVYRFLNIALPHYASEQIDFGTMLDFVQEARIGDLAFFINEHQEVNHVGVLLDTNLIIHASESNGKVAIDLFDQEGIINRSPGKRTHKLKAVKRILKS